MTSEPTKNVPSPSPAPPAETVESSELTAVVDDLLDSLQSKFASVSSEIYDKIEAMSRRLDAMEASLQGGGSSGGGGAK
ncbi:hypothetical protein BDD12DRAFT_885986 [Trichophaea hybrida]|nr:hypothetical protein BDD12DRAFT_885986 [Trichophaea hybrida]